MKWTKKIVGGGGGGAVGGACCTICGKCEGRREGIGWGSSVASWVKDP